MCVVGALEVVGTHHGTIMIEIDILNAGKVSAEQERIHLSKEASGTIHSILLEIVE